MTDGPIQWRCGRCSEVIDDGDGYIVIAFSEIRAHLAMRTLPGARGWRVVHRRCDRWPRDGYEINVERIRTARDLADWTRHLAEKAWLARSNWTELSRRAASALEFA
ncbi:MAG TPA: hypothetical protein VGR87_03960 [Candidatus Limnocylindria bacterium]|nr:hypothetical protein [Candidatus Limnocylindria bacterium]